MRVWALGANPNTHLWASANRQLLLSSMRAVGFVNYSHEWWHYSYGDRYWAFRTNAPAAIYGGR